MTYRLLYAAFVAALVVGCTNGRIQEETIEVKENTALERAKKMLESYSKGQVLGSEASSHDSLVAEVRKTDAARADVLQKGFADLQQSAKGKNKAATAAMAKDVLARLAPKMKAGE